MEAIVVVRNMRLPLQRRRIITRRVIVPLAARFTTVVTQGVPPVPITTWIVMPGIPARRISGF